MTACFLGAFFRLLSPGAQVVEGANLTHGFFASAVDIGRLQTLLGEGIARLDMAQVESRWAEVHAWMRGVILQWVQRCKMLRIQRCEEGVLVEVETQDDHGYYAYRLDVFPGR